jgi:hypothetical protein
MATRTPPNTHTHPLKARNKERITKNKARNKERRDSQLTNTFHEKKNSEAKFQKVELR